MRGHTLVGAIGHTGEVGSSRGRGALKRALAATTLVAVLGAGCAAAPDPGDIAAFCSLLETGTGLTASPEATDLDRLALVAPPAVRPTIEALQSRAKTFDELLTEEPPNLEALFNARFDAQARSEQRALASYANSSCGIATTESPQTRWDDYVQAEHAGAAWPSLARPSFETNDDRVSKATLTFLENPDPISLLEDACRAMSDFLIIDGAEPGKIIVAVGAVVELEYETPGGPCQLP